ncbi:MAG: hypothetical protein K0Q74_584 [Gammaproteobacteria bacterium]|nr:hypothetical protein [Gammaproteobacteria bacterium]
MIKMPDLSELKKTVNFQNIVDNVKSAIETVSNHTTSLPEGDELVGKFTEITGLVSNLLDMNAQQTRAIAHIKSKIHELEKDIINVKVAMAKDGIEKSTTSATEKSATSTGTVSSTAGTTSSTTGTAPSSTGSSFTAGGAYKSETTGTSKPVDAEIVDEYTHKHNKNKDDQK